MADPEILPAKGPAAEAPRPSLVLRGTPVAPGLAMGLALARHRDLGAIPVERVPRDAVAGELNRFHAALAASREQLDSLKGRLGGQVPAEHVRILDTHITYLGDSVFLTDVENLILQEQMSLEASIAKVILDFDRIFRLVENEALRERAVDLRDVGIRVLRNLERADAEPREEESPERGAVLVARELSIVDMFDLAGERVSAILTEAGSLTSHAAVLARSMGIPTLTSVAGVVAAIRDGDFVIVDATEGQVRVRPERQVREQFEAAAAASAASAAPRTDWIARTADGVEFELAATCGALPEVRRARDQGFASIGLYRTELLFLIDREPPGRETLEAHYRQVLADAGPLPVTFRLADLDSGLGVPWLYEGPEPNPALGRTGVRALLSHEAALRTQLAAILRAAADCTTPVGICVPKVVDCEELRRVKEVLFEERYALQREAIPHLVEPLVGVVLETPAAVLGAAALCAESDFVCVGLDSLQQYLLAADRGHPQLAERFDRLHPTVVHALRLVRDAARTSETPLSVFGVTAAARNNLPLLAGLGLHRLSLAPVVLEAVLEGLAQVRVDEARQLVERVLAGDE